MFYNAYLSVDVGPQTTKAWFFDDSQGSFDLRGMGTADTTFGTEFGVVEGTWAALRSLETDSGHRLLDNEGRLILTDIGEEGVRQCGLTLSAGRPIRTVLVAVSDTYSLAALRRLAAAFPTEIVLEVHLQDDRNATEQLEAMIRSQAELFVVAGGVDGGATKPLRTAIDNIRIIYENIPSAHKPQIVYAGNSDLVEIAKVELDAGEDLHLAGNVQPQFGAEDLSVAWKAMCTAFERLRLWQVPGLETLQTRLDSPVLPTLFAASRIVRLLDRTNPDGKGVLALEVNPATTGIILAHGSDFLALRDTAGLAGADWHGVQKMCAQPVEAGQAQAYAENLKIHPTFLPASLEDQAIHQALARARIRAALLQAKTLFDWLPYDAKSGLQAAYEPIILSGAVLADEAQAHQALLIALDGLQHHGITTFVLDRFNILPALGSLAEVEPLLAVQVIDSGIFQNLGTAICADSVGLKGRRILTIEVDEGKEERQHLQLRKGELMRVEVPQKARTRLYLAPTPGTDVGMGMAGLGGWVTVSGAEVGVVIDGRGRPIVLPDDDKTRVEALQNWQWELES